MSTPFRNYSYISLASHYARLFRWHQPIGIWLLLWPVLMSLWVASYGKPQITLIVLFVVGCVASRSTGCVINDLCDASIDAKVTRTKDRPLASGELNRKQAIIGCILPLLVCLVIVLYLGGNILFIGVLALLSLSVYPLSKRFVSHPQMILSFTYSLGIPMAWLAGGRSITETGWLWLFLGNMCWVYAYDTIYAMADKPDDIKLGVNSSAIAWGKHDVIGVIVGQLLAVTFLLLWLWQESLGYLTYIALLVVLAGFCWQIAYIRTRTISNCIAAFRSNHRLQLLLLLAIITDYWLDAL